MLREHLLERRNHVFIRFPHGGANSHTVKLVAPMSSHPLAATALDFGVDEAICGVMHERERLASLRHAQWLGSQARQLLKVGDLDQPPQAIRAVVNVALDLDGLVRGQLSGCEVFDLLF